MDKYKEVRDWNRNQSGGSTKDCDFFDIIDSVLGTRDIVQFTDVIGAGYECSVKETDPDLENSLAIPGPSTSNSFRVLHQEIIELSEQEGSMNDEERALSTHIQKRTERKKGKGKIKSEKEQELAKMEDVLEKMCKQGDALVAAVERMEENSRIQTNATQEMSKSISLSLSRRETERQRPISRPSPSPRKKRMRRREESDDSDVF